MTRLKQLHSLSVSLYKTKNHPMNIVVISCTKHPFFPALICAVLILYSNFLSVQLSGGLGKEALFCAFMLVWAHELSGEKRMANLGLSEVERIVEWKPNIQTYKTAVWMCVCIEGDTFSLKSLTFFSFPSNFSKIQDECIVILQHKVVKHSVLCSSFMLLLAHKLYKWNDNK